MKVYDLGNTQYDAVTSVGDFKLLTVVPDGATSGSPTYNATIQSYDLRDGSSAAAITSVGQLIVSLNGVIQKPNSGNFDASQEGFYLEGTNGIKFCTAPPSGSSVFVTLMGSAVGVGVPNDNSVAEAKLTTDSVSESKLKVGNSPVNGKFLQAQSGQSGGLYWETVDLTALSASNLTSGTIPDARFPSTLPAVDGSNLTGLQAGATGGNSGANAVFWENDQTITHDYTISTNKNAGSFGPLTINNGVTVTVPNNSTWTIV